MDETGAALKETGALLWGLIVLRVKLAAQQATDAAGRAVRWSSGSLSLVGHQVSGVLSFVMSLIVSAGRVALGAARAGLQPGYLAELQELSFASTPGKS